MVRDYKILASAARTAAGNSIDFTSDDVAGAGFGQFVIDVSAISGTTPVLTVFVEGYDSTSGKYFTLLQSAGLSVTGTNVLHVGPGLPAVANASANAMLTKNFRVRWTLTGTTPSATFSIGASVC